MAFNGIPFGPFSNAPLINVTNVTFPNLNEETNRETPPSPPEAEESTPAVIVSLSDEAQTLVEEGDPSVVNSNASAPAQQVIEPDNRAVDGVPFETNVTIEPLVFTGEEAAEVTENTDAATSSTATTSRLDEVRNEITRIVQTTRLSRPERAVLNRALEESGLDGTNTGQSTPQSTPGLENNNGRAVGIERNLLNLFQNNLSISSANTSRFDNLSSLFSSLIAPVSNDT